MKENIEDLIHGFVENRQYQEGVKLAESRLEGLEKTDYHKMIGRSFLHESDGTVEFISVFYNRVKEKINVEAMYFEMNGFGVNTDLWFAQAFAYKQIRYDEDDHDWLADYDFVWDEYVLQLTGYEDLQALYADYLERELYNNPLQNEAKEFSEEIVTLRFLELFQNAVDTGKRQKLPWANIPIFATSHDCDWLYKSF